MNSGGRQKWGAGGSDTKLKVNGPGHLEIGVPLLLCERSPRNASASLRSKVSRSTL